MFIQQISVFMGNEPGRLAEILRFLAGQGIDLRAYSVAETSDFGILRMIVRDTDATIAALREAGFTAKKNRVLGLLVPDKPGSTVEAFQLLFDAGVNVEYTYAFAMAGAGSAFVLLRVGDNDKAAQLLTQAGVRLASHADIF